jgi:hypothetical protein
MAKNITPEIMDTTLTKVMEKFADTFQQAITPLVAVLKDDMNTKMAAIALRLDTVETKLAQFQCKVPESAAAVNMNAVSGIEEATRALTAI